MAIVHRHNLRAIQPPATPRVRFSHKLNGNILYARVCACVCVGAWLRGRNGENAIHKLYFIWSEKLN